MIANDVSAKIVLQVMVKAQPTRASSTLDSFQFYGSGIVVMYKVLQQKPVIIWGMSVMDLCLMYEMEFSGAGDALNNDSYYLRT